MEFNGTFFPFLIPWKWELHWIRSHVNVTVILLCVKDMISSELDSIANLRDTQPLEILPFVREVPGMQMVGHYALKRSNNF